jgi:hypothetical protein
MRDEAAHLPASELDPQQDLVGGVFDVPDSLWKIDTRAEQHPGACTRYDEPRHEGTLLQGTDAENVRPSLAWRYHCIDPDGDNGLTTRTAFRLVPRYFRLHRLRLLHAGRVRGRLNQADLEALRRAMLHLYGP